jgi:hypothetical protein
MNQAPAFHAVIPAQAGTQEIWITTSVGMTLQPNV